ncbi:MAG: hypothetical protein QMD12_03415 [Candidatus Aenigmarchaeota archaeon]|nr:hypothetical protein [Candidatus Aenigmarchaeota archaeon]
MSEIVGDGRSDRSKYGIVYRAVEKALVLPLRDLSEDEFKKLGEEIERLHEQAKTNRFEIKIPLGKYESVCIYSRRFGTEERLFVDGFRYGCTVENFREIANEIITTSLVGEKLGEYWGTSREETKKRIKEITKRHFF